MRAQDSVSIHSIKKAEYARRIAEGNFGHVTLLDHFINVGDLGLSLSPLEGSFNQIIDIW
jgi:hypothetical protein